MIDKLTAMTETVDGYTLLIGRRVAVLIDQPGVLEDWEAILIGFGNQRGRIGIRGGRVGQAKGEHRDGNQSKGGAKPTHCGTSARAGTRSEPRAECYTDSARISQKSAERTGVEHEGDLGNFILSIEQIASPYLHIPAPVARAQSSPNVGEIIAWYALVDREVGGGEIAGPIALV